MLQAMARLQSEPDLREQLGRNGRQAFEGHWTEAAVVPQYYRLFHEIAERTGQGRVAEKLNMEGVA